MESDSTFQSQCGDAYSVFCFCFFCFRDPGLFSLITSLHKSYQSTVLGDSHLQPLFQKLVSHSPQTSCYVLLASLGVTRALHSEEQVMLPIKLPHWSFQEAQTVRLSMQKSIYQRHCNNTLKNPKCIPCPAFKPMHS